jgi:hypothetical protein
MGRDWASRLATTSSGSSNFTDSELDSARRKGTAAQQNDTDLSGHSAVPQEGRIAQS